MKESYRQNYSNDLGEQKVLTQEEQFEKLIQQWKKESKDKLNDISKSKNRKRPDSRYRLSPFRFEQ